MPIQPASSASKADPTDSPRELYYTCSNSWLRASDLIALWGGQFWPQPAFSRLLRGMRVFDSFKNPPERRLRAQLPAPRRGFTLLEMLVATAIMAIAVVGLLSTIGGATRNAAKVRDYDRISQLARLRMNELLAEYPIGMAGTFDPRLTGGLQVQWQARVSVVEAPPQRMLGQPALQRVELTLSWEEGGQPHTFSLDAFHTHYLMQGDL